MLLIFCTHTGHWIRGLFSTYTGAPKQENQINGHAYGYALRDS